MGNTYLGLLSNERDVRSFEAGESIFEIGDPADLMYGVVEGRIVTEIAGAVAEKAGPGEIFGEMALIDGNPRSARAIAETDCRLAAIDERRFKFLVQQPPNFALELMKILAERLRRESRAKT